MLLEEEEYVLPTGEKRKRREVIDCVLIIRKPKKGFKRLGISASTVPNKRVKLASSTNFLDGSPIEEPLFVPVRWVCPPIDFSTEFTPTSPLVPLSRVTTGTKKM